MQKREQLHLHRKFALQFISILVAAHGVFTLASILLAQIVIRRSTHLSNVDFDVPLLAGLSLIYLSTQLKREKYAAWLVAMGGYGVYLGLAIAGWLSPLHAHEIGAVEICKNFILPVIVLALLVVFRQDYVVRSDIQGFRGATRFSLAILIVALLYGVAGMQLLDTRDFHQEISVPAAAHYTIDQFNITTDHPLTAYSRRAQFFLDSLSFVSTAAVLYALISLFQPLRMRLTDPTPDRQIMSDLLEKHGGKSEDFFKLWPHDKQYFFDEQRTSGVAFHAAQGVAVVLGDPAGQRKQFSSLLSNFDMLCHRNGWLPAMIHIQKTYRRLYESHGYTLQKLGQEAILDIDHFKNNVACNKYFRQIRNKLARQGIKCELLTPPYHQAVIDRLKVISDEWLSGDGRVERKFVMGYFDPAYIKQCKLMVARDAAGTIQAFINLVPAGFDKNEATFDMLRQTRKGPGNINDFLIMNYIDYLAENGYKHLNLGLCPLAGLDEKDDDANKLISSFLRFAYANGDRFYSFSGLYRFKAKFEPEWRDRYIAYKQGVRGFSRTMTASMLVMRVSRRKPISDRLLSLLARWRAG